MRIIKLLFRLLVALHLDAWPRLGGRNGKRYNVATEMDLSFFYLGVMPPRTPYPPGAGWSWPSDGSKNDITGYIYLGFFGLL